MVDPTTYCTQFGTQLWLRNEKPGHSPTWLRGTAPRRQAAGRSSYSSPYALYDTTACRSTRGSVGRCLLGGSLLLLLVAPGVAVALLELVMEVGDGASLPAAALPGVAPCMDASCFCCLVLRLGQRD